MTPTEQQLLQRVEQVERLVSPLVRGDGKYTTIPPNAIYPTVGDIAAGGTANKIPAGWSSVKNSTGNYTITHNLGNTRYVVLLTPFLSPAGGVTVILSAMASTSFTVETFSVLNAAADVPFTFMLFPY